MLCPSCHKDILIIGAIACPYCAANLAFSVSEAAEILGLTGHENQIERAENYRRKLWEISTLIKNSPDEATRRHYEDKLDDVERSARAYNLEYRDSEMESVENTSMTSTSLPESEPMTAEQMLPPPLPVHSTTIQPNEMPTLKHDPSSLRGRIEAISPSPQIKTFIGEVSYIEKHKKFLKNAAGIACWIMVILIAIHDESRKRIGCFFGYEGSCSSLGALFYNHAESPADKRKAQEFFEKGCKNKEKAGCQQIEKMKAEGELTSDTSIKLNDTRHKCKSGDSESCQEVTKLEKIVIIRNEIKNMRIE